MEATPPTLPGLDRLIGLELIAVTPDEVRAGVPVRPEILQPFGLVHGGVYAAVAESLASVGTAAVVLEQGMTAMGMSNTTTFLRSIAAGTVHARAVPRHRGRTTWVWDVEITDDAGSVCAVSRVTIAVRPARTPAVAPPLG
ncbi:MAG: PaaI family thioesterase [Actinobacteria bacterium]|nr:PaaI family thioesterase [Actinomycetota bacterium]